MPSPSWSAVVLAAVLALLAAACTNSDGPVARGVPSEPATLSPPSTTAPPPAEEQAEAPGSPSEGTEAEAGPPVTAPPPTEAERELLAGVSGLLAVGDGGRLTVIQPDGTEIRELNDGASALADQSTWAPDGGRLAWARTSFDGHELVVTDLAAAEPLVSPAPGTLAFYLQWSSGGERVAYLRSDSTGALLELGSVIPGEPVAVHALGSPLYLAWSPVVPELVLHIGDDRVARVDADTVAGAAADGTEPADPPVVLEPTGAFTTPAWVDGRTVLLATEDGLTLLDLDAGTTDLLVAAPEIDFVLSPDRRRVAYYIAGSAASISPVAATQAVERPPTPRFEAVPGLAVLDLDSGDTIQVSAGLPLSFEWSPDGARLAWLSPVPGQPANVAQWWFWTGGTDDDAISSAEPYAISQRAATTVLPFFEQFAQSLHRWSPDGRGFAFAGVLDGRPVGEPEGIWIHLIDQDAPSIRVVDGDYVTWGR